MPIKNSQNVSLAQTTLSLAVQNPLFNAPDNAISNGIAYAGWTVDGGSSKGVGGITLKRAAGNEFAYIDVSGLAASTTYWCRVKVTAKSAGATGYLRVTTAGGSNFTSVSNGNLDLSAVTTGFYYYFQLKTDATAGPWRLRIVHQVSPDNETITFEDFRIFPPAARSSAKVAVQGDRAGGFNAAYASITNKAIISPTADTKNLVVMGDQADTTNSFATCDCLQVASCVTTNGSAVVTAPSGSFSDLVAGVGITGTGIPASTTVLSVDSDTQITLSANATANGTVTLTMTSVLQKVIQARGGERYNTLGNHDYDASREVEITSYFAVGARASNNNSGKGYYSKVLGEMEFFFIDDNDAASGNAGQELTDNAGGISATAANFAASTAGQWITNALAASTAKWKIVVIHHPAYTSSSAGAFTANRWDWKGRGVSVVFQAHDHGVERMYVGGVYYYTQGMGGGNHHGWAARAPETEFRVDSSGQAGASFGTTYGYVKLSDSPTALVLEFFDTNHTMLDRAKLTQP